MNTTRYRIHPKHSEMYADDDDDDDDMVNETPNNATLHRSSRLFRTAIYAAASQLDSIEQFFLKHFVPVECEPMKRADGHLFAVVQTRTDDNNFFRRTTGWWCRHHKKHNQLNKSISSANRKK